jgi:hypothetical protein
MLDLRKYSPNGLIFPSPEPFVYDRTPCLENGEWEIARTKSEMFESYPVQWILGYTRMTHDAFVEFFEFATWHVPMHDENSTVGDQLPPYWLIADVDHVICDLQ